MATEFEIKAGERAAMQAAPGMGGFSARQVSKAVIEAVDQIRTATAVAAAIPICLNCGKPAVGNCTSTSVHHRVG